MSDKLAKIISIVFHPLMMPTLTIAFILYFAPMVVKPLPDASFLPLIAVVFVLTYIIPLISVSFIRLNHIVYYIKVLKEKFSKKVSYQEAAVLVSQNYGYEIHEFSRPSLWMKTKEERVMPFFFITVFYAMCAYLFLFQWKFNPLFGVVMGSITITLLVITIITIIWKISAHSTGVAGVLGFLLAINMKFPDNHLLFPIVFMVMLSGLVMSSRLQLRDHDPKEVYWGYLLGFTISFAAIYFFA